MMYSGVVFLSLALAVAGYSMGPPVGQAGHDDLCEKMVPTGHGVAAQTGAVPYTYVLSQSCYKEGMAVKVAIKANHDHATVKYFEGFLTQVQKDGENTVNYGTFTTDDGDYSKTYDCFSNAGSAVGHKAKEHFLTRVFTWTAPATVDDSQPALVFRTTIVNKKVKFWVDFKSDPITYKADCAMGDFTETAEIEEHSHSHEATEEPSGEATEAPTGSSTALLPGVLAAMATLILAILLQ